MKTVACVSLRLIRRDAQAPPPAHHHRTPTIASPSPPIVICTHSHIPHSHTLTPTHSHTHSHALALSRPHSHALTLTLTHPPFHQTNVAQLLPVPSAQLPSPPRTFLETHPYRHAHACHSQDERTRQLIRDGYWVLPAFPSLVAGGVCCRSRGADDG